MHPDLPQDISNIWRSANFIESVPSLCINPVEQELTEDSPLSLDFEADMSHSVPLEDLYPPTSTDRLQLNSHFMQNSCDISPSLTVVPPTPQALEDTSIFDICLTEQQQEVELQKNLVKDVFFSPAMFEHHTRNLSFCSFEGSNDDCHSVISDSTVSSSYCYAKEDNEDLSLPSHHEDQISLFYGLELSQSTTSSNTSTAEGHDNRFETIGLGSIATSSKTTKTVGCNRRTNQQVRNNSRRGSHHSPLTAVKKTICRQEKSKSLSRKSKKRLEQREDLDAYRSESDAISCYSQKLDGTSAWEHKESNNTTDFVSGDPTVSKTSASRLTADNKSQSNCRPTLYEKLSKLNIDWCRYCGTTEGVNWRPGPWGKRTLCNKHGCDYKGYGFACKLPRLDLTSFASETISERVRPVMQLFCSHCQLQESLEDNQLVLCDGCPKSFHQNCFHDGRIIASDFTDSFTPWYCSNECQDNLKRKKVIVELPRKRLPLMRTPKNSKISNPRALNPRTRTINISL